MEWKRCGDGIAADGYEIQRGATTRAGVWRFWLYGPPGRRFLAVGGGEDAAEFKAAAQRHKETGRVY